MLRIFYAHNSLQMHIYLYMNIVRFFVFVVLKYCIESPAYLSLCRRWTINEDKSNTHAVYYRAFQGETVFSWTRTDPWHCPVKTGRSSDGYERSERVWSSTEPHHSGWRHLSSRQWWLIEKMQKWLIDLHILNFTHTLRMMLLESIGMSITSSRHWYKLLELKFIEILLTPATLSSWYYRHMKEIESFIIRW